MFLFRPYEKIVLNAKIKQKQEEEAAYVREVLKYRGEEELLEQFNNWEIPRFPINGKILKDAGVPAGKTYGRIIDKLKNLWIENNYQQNAEDLVKHIPDIIKQLDSNDKNKQA